MILKIFAGITAFTLIGFMLYVTNALVGNPISSMLADKAINQYVNQKYSFLDLEIEKPSYNFKNTSYMVRAKSKTSIDTNFAIYYRDGIIRDDYEDYVLSKFNTFQRLSNDYSFLAKGIIAKELGYENNFTTVTYDKETFGNNSANLQLDMKFDKKIDIDADVYISINLIDNSLEEIANVLTDAHNAFIKNECYFKNYSLYSSNNGKNVMVYGVTSSDIESGDLLSKLTEAQKDKDVVVVDEVKIKDYNDKLTVYIKDM